MHHTVDAGPKSMLKREGIKEINVLVDAEWKLHVLLVCATPPQHQLTCKATKCVVLPVRTWNEREFICWPFDETTVFADIIDDRGVD